MPRIIFLLGLLSTPLLAQDKPAAPVKKAASGAEVRFVAQALPRGLGEVVMVSEEGSSGAFKIPLNNLSSGQKAPARTFVLTPAGKKKPLARVSLPEKGKEFIVLLVVGKQPGFTPVVLPAKGGGFKPGDVYLHNTAGGTILGEVGTVKFTVAPSKGRVVTPKGARENRFYDVKLGVRENGRTSLISSSRWPVDPRVRSYVFFFDNPQTKRVDFRAVDEFVPVEKRR